MSVKKSECLLRLFHKYGFNSGTINLAFSILFGRGKMIKVNLSAYPYPFYLRREGSDIEVFFEIMLLMGYKFRTKLDHTPKTIIDCGANIGLASIYFKSRFPDVHIIAVEPEKNNFILMSENLQQYKDIICENIGIWNKETYVSVRFPDSINSGFSFKEAPEYSEGSIKALSITDLMKKHSLEQIDILKIDIEGAEKELFTFGYEYWLSRTRLIIIELHDKSVEGCSKALFNALSKYNFSTEVRGENLLCFIKQ